MTARKMTAWLPSNPVALITNFFWFNFLFLFWFWFLHPKKSQSKHWFLNESLVMFCADNGNSSRWHSEIIWMSSMFIKDKVIIVHCMVNRLNWMKQQHNILWNWFWRKSNKKNNGNNEILLFMLWSNERGVSGGGWDVYAKILEFLARKFNSERQTFCHIFFSSSKYITFIVLHLLVMLTYEPAKTEIFHFHFWMDDRFRCRATYDKTSTSLFHISLDFWISFFFLFSNLIFRLDEQHCARNVRVVFNILMILRSSELDRVHYEII